MWPGVNPTLSYLSWETLSLRRKTELCYKLQVVATAPASQVLSGMFSMYETLAKVPSLSQLPSSKMQTLGCVCVCVRACRESAGSGLAPGSRPQHL